VLCFRYPNYDIFGDPELFKIVDLDKSIMNINIDLYLLSQCNYLVCTFSSHVRITNYLTKYYNNLIIPILLVTQLLNS